MDRKGRPSSYLYGSGRRYFLRGKNNDFLKGNDGDDTIYGQKGHDTIFGGWGDNTLYGGRGDDWIWGPKDKIYGGRGDDLFTIYGGEDITGGRGADKYLMTLYDPVFFVAPTIQDFNIEEDMIFIHTIFIQQMDLEEHIEIYSYDGEIYISDNKKKIKVLIINKDGKPNNDLAEAIIDQKTRRYVEEGYNWDLRTYVVFV